MNERNDTRANDEFAQKAGSLFDESVEGLDAGTRSRLNRSRQAALAQLDTDRADWLHWAPAAAVAAVAVVAVVLWSGNRPAGLPAPDSAAADLEILLDEDSLEMLEELEFYSWIELAGEPDPAPQSGDQVG